MSAKEPLRYDWPGPKRPKCPACTMTVLPGQPCIKYDDGVVIHEHCELIYAPNVIANLQRLVADGYDVVQDFARNIRHVSLEDYRSYNQFCVEAKKIKDALTAQGGSDA